MNLKRLSKFKAVLLLVICIIVLIIMGMIYYTLQNNKNGVSYTDKINDDNQLKSGFLVDIKDNLDKEYNIDSINKSSLSYLYLIKNSKKR